ncbi:MAG: hypothetical protein EZS28_020826, partial [Streblomastix strix]
FLFFDCIYDLILSYASPSPYEHVQLAYRYLRILRQLPPALEYREGATTRAGL